MKLNGIFDLSQPSESLLLYMRIQHAWPKHAFAHQHAGPIYATCNPIIFK
jgi:hypothetical protein